MCTWAVMSWRSSLGGCNRLMRWDVHRKVYASFGGLLLYLEGPFKNLTSLRSDNVYLLAKK